MSDGRPYDLFAWLVSQENAGLWWTDPEQEQERERRRELTDKWKRLVQRVSKGTRPYAGLSAHTRAHLLAHARLGSGQLAAMARDKDGLLGLYHQEGLNGYPAFVKEQERLMNELGLLSSAPKHRDLPPWTWFLRVYFRLAEPLITADDAPLWVVDHPVRKERNFGVPHIAASSWKGLLRDAVVRHADQNVEPSVVARLFGTAPERTEEAGGQSGALHFYPTFFFTAPTLQVFNPHSRTTGAGKDPFYLEAIPADTEGRLDLLYWPLALPEDAYHSGEHLREQATRDRCVVLKGLFHLFQLGVGAKRTLSFGRVDPASVKGTFFWPGGKEQYFEGAEALKACAEQGGEGV